MKHTSSDPDRPTADVTEWSGIGRPDPGAASRVAFSLSGRCAGLQSEIFAVLPEEGVPLRNRSDVYDDVLGEIAASLKGVG